MHHPHENQRAVASHIPWTTVAENLNNAWKFYAKHGEKIEAIKLYRSLYGVGLKEAKDGVEAYINEAVYAKWRDKYIHENYTVKQVLSGLITDGVDKNTAKGNVLSWISKQMDVMVP